MNRDIEGVSIRTTGAGNLSYSFITNDSTNSKGNYQTGVPGDPRYQRALNGLQTNTNSSKHTPEAVNINTNIDKSINNRNTNNTSDNTTLQNSTTSKNAPEFSDKPTEKGYKHPDKNGYKYPIHIRHQRVIIGIKETIEGIPPPNTDPHKDWTGTFTDPRFRSPEPENSLTGQKFGVNGPRSDYMEIGKNDAKLRFWRNTDLSAGGVKMPYRTAVGILGYEWDFYSHDCHQPKGSFTLSSSTKNVSGFVDIYMYIV